MNIKLNVQFAEDGIILWEVLMDVDVLCSKF